jgi:hypothetical protein
LGNVQLFCGKGEAFCLRNLKKSLQMVYIHTVCIQP